MTKHLRNIFVTIILATALLIAAGAALFHSQHLSFYNPQQAQSKFGVSQRDLALVQYGRPTYIWVIPQAGTALKLLRQPAALIAMVYVPALAISMYEIRRLANHRRPTNFL